MSTFRRRLLATAALPAAALGFLLAAPGAASASTASVPVVASSYDGDHWNHHQHHRHHGLGLHLGLVLGLQISGHGGWYDNGDWDDGLFLGD
ncbi:hypothetical protein [Amycolatopsis sp. CA-128772]|uniref:hypothetical protein n=1 Tax=Amycolatopsis sp. CA-128772 TaxID=2073159 RepID=UPI000CD2E0AC|nr:hypothetical protein [Amycolatopsis sp. CA-128772]